MKLRSQNVVELLPEQASDEACVSIYVNRTTDDATWHVTSLQADMHGATTRTHLKARPTLADALVGQLVDEIEYELGTLDDQELRIVGDRIVVLPGAALVGLRMSSLTKDDQTRVVVVSFLRVIGNALAVLHPDLRPVSTTLSDRDRLAIQVLVDLVQPCLDIIRAADAGALDTHRDLLLTRLTTLQEKSAELEFIASLLTRLIIQEDHETIALPTSARVLPAV